MKYFLNQKNKGHVVINRKKCIPVSQILGAFSYRVKIPANRKDILLPENKSWILLENKDIIQVRKNSRYLISDERFHIQK